MPRRKGTLPPLTPQDKKQALTRAREWKQFRKAHLFTQQRLADSLGCGRRTICAIESGREVFAPRADLLRGFRELKREQIAQQREYELAVAS